MKQWKIVRLIYYYLTLDDNNNIKNKKEKRNVLILHEWYQRVDLFQT